MSSRNQLPKAKHGLLITESLVDKYCNKTLKDNLKDNLIEEHRKSILASLTREQRSIDRVKKLKANEKHLLSKIDTLNDHAKQQIANFVELASIADYALSTVNDDNCSSDLTLASLVYIQALAKYFVKDLTAKVQGS